MTRPGLPMMLGALAVILAVFAIIGGFMLNGSPMTRRAQALDQRRVDDLRAIASAITQPQYGLDGTMKTSEPLPASLDALRGRQDAYLRAEQMRDPDTDVPYRYRTTGDRTFELCATFALPTPDDATNDQYRTGNEFWNHGAGEKCFTLDADKLIY